MTLARRTHRTRRFLRGGIDMPAGKQRKACEPLSFEERHRRAAARLGRLLGIAMRHGGQPWGCYEVARLVARHAFNVLGREWDTQ